MTVSVRKAIVEREKAESWRKICTNCHFVGTAKMPGAGWIEFLLYFFYCVPGIFYSIWRRRKIKRNVCPACGMPAMIPTYTPAGKALLAERRAAQDTDEAA